MGEPEGTFKITLRQDVLKLISDVAADLAKSGVAEPLEVLASLIAVFYLMAPDARSARQLLDEIAPKAWQAVEATVMKGAETEH